MTELLFKGNCLWVCYTLSIIEKKIWGCELIVSYNDSLFKDMVYALVSVFKKLWLRYVGKIDNKLKMVQIIKQCLLFDDFILMRWWTFIVPHSKIKLV